MPVTLFTSETAAANAVKAALARKRNTLTRKAMIAAQKAGLIAIAPPEPIAARRNDPPAYFEKRLARVRVQLDRIDAMMLQEVNPQAIERLAAAATRLAEQERIYDGRPLPGQLRPRSSRAQSAKSDPSDVVPE